VIEHEERQRPFLAPIAHREQCTLAARPAALALAVEVRLIGRVRAGCFAEARYRVALQHAQFSGRRHADCAQHRCERSPRVARVRHGFVGVWLLAEQVLFDDVARRLDVVDDINEQHEVGRER
jgi:hypothetical protein